jgi:hypothetical protein
MGMYSGIQAGAFAQGLQQNLQPFITQIYERNRQRDAFDYAMQEMDRRERLQEELRRQSFEEGGWQRAAADLAQQYQVATEGRDYERQLKLAKEMALLEEEIAARRGQEGGMDWQRQQNELERIMKRSEGRRGGGGSRESRGQEEARENKIKLANGLIGKRNRGEQLSAAEEQYWENLVREGIIGEQPGQAALGPPPGSVADIDMLMQQSGASGQGAPQTRVQPPTEINLTAGTGQPSAATELPNYSADPEALRGAADWYVDRRQSLAAQGAPADALAAFDARIPQDVLQYVLGDTGTPGPTTVPTWGVTP